MRDDNCQQKRKGFFNFDFEQFGKNFEEMMNKANINDLINEEFAHKTPLVNLFETEEGLLIELAAPGLDKSAFKVTIEGRNLVISTRENVNKNIENVKVKRKEYDYSTFKRSFRLSNKYDPNRIQAQYEQGILKVKVAFINETQKNSIEIEIK